MSVDPQSKDLIRFQADHVWIDQNREILLTQYPEQWIAVQDSQVIASDPDFDGLLAKLPEPSGTAVEFLTREPIETVL
jgi:Family of unknown function (DUF5678)